MSIAETNWNLLNSMNGDELRSAVFSLLQTASIDVQEREPDDPAVLSAVPRIADLIASKDELKDFSQMYSALARSVGLWNYIDKEEADARDLIIAEAVTFGHQGLAQR